MKLPRLKTILLTPLISFAVLYVALAIYVLLDDRSVAPLNESLRPPLSIAIFGAGGTAGDGILQAALASPDSGKIHVDFPLRFVSAWSRVSQKPEVSFNYISSSDISEDSTAVWAREKVRAEKLLFKFAEGSNMRVIAYRPDYIGPTEEEARLGQELMYGFFAPVRAAVRAKQIGQAMIEVTARGDEFDNGRKLGTGPIIRSRDTYLERNKEG